VTNCGRTVGGNSVGTAALSALLIIGKLIVNPLDKACLGVMVASGVLSTTLGVGSTVTVLGPLEIAGKKMDERAGSQLASSKSTMMYKIYTRCGHKLRFFVGQ
jgi:hypothetical protein